MLAPRLLRITTKPPPPNLRAVTLRTTRRLSLTPASKMKDSTKSCSPPAHAMAYFPNMTTALPSSSGEFRKVLWTGLFSQVVLMTVPVGGDIGDEVHLVDQALTFTSGQGMATINGQSQKVKAGDLMVVPAGTQHQFINTGPTPLILYTIYSPAEHDPRSIHHTKAEGEAEEHAGQDEAPDWARKSLAENVKLGFVNESGKYTNEGGK